MIEGRDIVCISSIDWDFNWQGPQELTSRLAKAGNHVLFVENTGIRSPGLKDAARVAHRLRRWFGSLASHGLRKVNANLYVHAPLVLPPSGPDWVRRLNANLFLRQVRNAVLRLGMRDVVILCYLPTDTAVDLIEMLRTPRSVVVYYRVDNLPLLAPQPERLRRSEEALSRLSDLIFANSVDLAKMSPKLNHKVHVFPPSVNLEAFNVDEQSTAPANTGVPTKHDRAAGRPRVPRNIASHAAGLKRPVIGYIGTINQHFDHELLTGAARLRPQWSWVLVGPRDISLGEWRRLPNVHVLGQQPHRDLVKFIREFDVCIIPYRLSAYTATVVPTKLREYLAVGKPVVSTKLPAVCSFNQEHNVIVTSDERPECFLRAIEEALQLPNDEEAIENRRAVARGGDWQTRIEEMSELLEAALESKKMGATPSPVPIRSV